MHAVVLKSLGRKVIVLESREHGELQAEAAGLSLGPNAQKLVNKYLEVDESFAIDTPGSQILSPTGEIVAEIPATFPVNTCTWGLVFERLKANFLSPERSGTAFVYRTGLKVTRFEHDGRHTPLKVVCLNTVNKTEIAFEAPLVIGADGARSTIRSQLEPTIKSDYAGYVAWRGCIPETQAPKILKGALEGKLVFTMLQGHYIIA
jgi:2-polyprenyl-6-methoxyphenol hydroxylase-like FAD-dependent oxidoreductase